MGVTYLYHPGQSDQWGDNVRWNKPFIAGQWHKIQMCYAMNTVGSANGKLLVWFDGTQVRNDTNVVYRSTPTCTSPTSTGASSAAAATSAGPARAPTRSTWTA